MRGNNYLQEIQKKKVKKQRPFMQIPSKLVDIFKEYQYKPLKKYTLYLGF